ncbi:MAG: hypothetical protein M3O06_06235 [Pseudomonadota bacterium]|nr:hypothetical protein [Pseudomonadota bacterium]
MLKDGEIAFEDYEMGTDENTHWMSMSQYLSDSIWTKVGMESDATWWLESPCGAEIGGIGLSATLRDYGRFGLFL